MNCAYPNCNQINSVVPQAIQITPCFNCDKLIYCSEICRKNHWETGHNKTCNVDERDNDNINDKSTNKKMKKTLNDYEIVSTSQNNSGEIDKGSYGYIKLVKEKNNNGFYALKIINKVTFIKNASADQLKREVKIHKKLKHSHIIRLYHYFEDLENVYLILEYAENGNLFNYLRKKKRLSEQETFIYFFQTSLGLDYLHKHYIIHRDIKPENLLLDKTGNIKICDLGCSAKSISNRRTFCGTIEYLAPEILEYRPYNQKVDIWALGILMYELLHGIVPFKGKSYEILSSINKGYIHFDDKISPEAKSLIKLLLNTDPCNRPNFDEIFNHPWLKLQEKNFKININDYIYKPSKKNKSDEKIESNEPSQNIKTTNNDQALPAKEEIIKIPLQEDIPVTKTEPSLSSGKQDNLQNSVHTIIEEPANRLPSELPDQSLQEKIKLDLAIDANESLNANEVTKDDIEPTNTENGPENNNHPSERFTLNPINTSIRNDLELDSVLNQQNATNLNDWDKAAQGENKILFGSINDDKACLGSFPISDCMVNTPKNHPMTNSIGNENRNMANNANTADCEFYRPSEPQLNQKNSLPKSPNNIEIETYNVGSNHEPNSSNSNVYTESIHRVSDPIPDVPKENIQRISNSIHNTSPEYINRISSSIHENIPEKAMLVDDEYKIKDSIHSKASLTLEENKHQFEEIPKITGYDSEIRVLSSFDKNDNLFKKSLEISKSQTDLVIYEDSNEPYIQEPQFADQSIKGNSNELPIKQMPILQINVDIANETEGNYHSTKLDGFPMQVNAQEMEMFNRLDTFQAKKPFKSEIDERIPSSEKILLQVNQEKTRIPNATDMKDYSFKSQITKSSPINAVQVQGQYHQKNLLNEKIYKNQKSFDLSSNTEAITENLKLDGLAQQTTQKSIEKKATLKEIQEKSQKSEENSPKFGCVDQKISKGDTTFSDYCQLIDSDTSKCTEENSRPFTFGENFPGGGDLRVRQLKEDLEKQRKLLEKIQESYSRNYRYNDNQVVEEQPIKVVYIDEEVKFKDSSPDIMINPIKEYPPKSPKPSPSPRNGLSNKNKEYPSNIKKTREKSLCNKSKSLNLADNSQSNGKDNKQALIISQQNHDELLKKKIEKDKLELELKNKDVIINKPLDYKERLVSTDANTFGPRKISKERGISPRACKYRTNSPKLSPKEITNNKPINKDTKISNNIEKSANFKKEKSIYHPPNDIKMDEPPEKRCSFKNKAINPYSSCYLLTQSDEDPNEFEDSLTRSTLIISDRNNQEPQENKELSFLDTLKQIFACIDREPPPQSQKKLLFSSSSSSSLPLLSQSPSHGMINNGYKENSNKDQYNSNKKRTKLILKY